MNLHNENPKGQDTGSIKTADVPVPRKPWLTCLKAITIILIVGLAYIPAIRAQFIWDDDKYLYATDHHVIEPADGLKRIWTTTAAPQYYPLVFTTYWLEYRIWGFNPAGYHVVNILMHAVIAILVWRILLRLNIPGAWLAAAIFALHPVHVESVAWITERKNVLSGLFYMLSMLCYLHFAQKPNWRWYGIALITFVLALFSKTVTCSLPVAILLLLWLKRQRVQSAVLIGLVPFFVFGLFMGKLTSWYEFHKVNPAYWEPMPISRAVKLAWTEGTSGDYAGYDISTPARVIIASRALVFYAKKIIVPYPLAFFYHRWDTRVELNDGVLFNYWPVALVLLIAVGIIVLSLRYGRSLFIAAAYFGVTLFPALGFFDVWPMRYSFVADHFQYLASLGLITALVAGLSILFRAFNKTARPPLTRGDHTGVDLSGSKLTPLNPPLVRGEVLLDALSSYKAVLAAVVPAAILLFVLAAATFSRSKAFHDQETIWSDTIAKTPDAWMARNHLGVFYAQRGNPGDEERAAELFEAIISANPDFPEAYSNFGNLLVKKKQLDKAERMFRKAIELQPQYDNLYIRLATVLIFQGKSLEAVGVYEKAAQVIPNSWRIYDEWGKLLNRMGLPELAAEKQAIAETLGRPQPTATTYVQAPQTAPTSAPLDHGGAQAKPPRHSRQEYIQAADEAMDRGQFDRAMDILEDGLKAFRTSAALWQRYGLLLAASPMEYMRDGKKAVKLGQMLHNSLAKMNRLDPEMMEMLAAAYAETGRFDEALEAAKKGLELATDIGYEKVRIRLQKQIELYKTKQAYRLGSIILAVPATQQGSTQAPNNN